MGHHHDHPTAAGDPKAARKSLRIALALNLLLAAVAAVGGHLSSSLALWSDAGHLLVDVGGILVVIVAAGLGGRAADKRHTYGHRRLEVLAAVINAGFLLLIAAGIVIAAIPRFQQGPVVNSRVMLITAALTSVGNFAAAWALWRTRGSLGVRAALMDMLADGLASVGVLLAALLIHLTGRQLFDPVISLFIAGMIVVGALKLLLDASHILLEGVPAGLELDELRDAMKRVEGVLEIHDLHVWSITLGDMALSAHVRHCVENPDGLLDELSRLLAERFEIGHTTLQLEQAHCERPGRHE